MSITDQESIIFQIVFHIPIHISTNPVLAGRRNATSCLASSSFSCFVFWGQNMPLSFMFLLIRLGYWKGILYKKYGKPRQSKTRPDRLRQSGTETRRCPLVLKNSVHDVRVVIVTYSISHGSNSISCHSVITSPTGGGRRPQKELIHYQISIPDNTQ